MMPCRRAQPSSTASGTTPGQRRAHRMRDLGRVPERERLVAGQPARQAAPRLYRRVRLAALMKTRLDHPVGEFQRGLDVAVGEDSVIRAIGWNRLVDPRQAGILGMLGIDDGG